MSPVVKEWTNSVPLRQVYEWNLKWEKKWKNVVRCCCSLVNMVWLYVTKMWIPSPPDSCPWKGLWQETQEIERKRKRITDDHDDEPKKMRRWYLSRKKNANLLKKTHNLILYRFSIIDSCFYKSNFQKKCKKYRETRDNVRNLRAFCGSPFDLFAKNIHFSLKKLWLDSLIVCSLLLWYNFFSLFVSVCYDFCRPSSLKLLIYINLIKIMKM